MPKIRESRPTEEIYAEISEIALRFPGIAELWSEEPYFFPQRRAAWNPDECNWELVMAKRVSSALKDAIEAAAAEVQQRFNLGTRIRAGSAPIWIETIQAIHKAC